jgi:SpoIID/LytB domain protein
VAPTARAGPTAKPTANPAPASAQPTASTDPVPPETVERAPVTVAATYELSGAGYGHGWGMSQYGAYGAARRGLTWPQILRFYYPGTSRTLQRPRATIRVWVSADKDDELRLPAAAGLRISDSLGHSRTLPRGTRYTGWRLKRSGSHFALSYRNPSGSWTRYRPPLSATTWWFSRQGKLVTILLPKGVRRELRGAVGLVKDGKGGRTVNRVYVEDYVRGVVPAEMPTSWPGNAVRAQAVAARSYAVRLQARRKGAGGYDVCDTTSCQVYRGYASTSKGRRTVHETGRGDLAVRGTARTVLAYRGTVAYTQFASSNGGSSAKGDFPYLVAKLDPYDGLVRSNRWSKTLTASRIGRAFPSVGAVRSVRVTERNGVGRWGGRVVRMRIVGADRTITVTGDQFRLKFGLRSTLFTL